MMFIRTTYSTTFRTAVTSDERWKVYTDVTIDVAMLQEVHANEGSDNVAVVHYSKMWTMIGKFLADGDQVRRPRLIQRKIRTR